jgi:DNA polymerase I
MAPQRAPMLAIVIADGVGAALVPVDPTSGSGDTPAVSRWLPWQELAAEVRRLDQTESPRWVWWPDETSRLLVSLDIRPGRCWDLGAVHRMIVGGWRSSPTAIWAACHGLDDAPDPSAGVLRRTQPSGPDLFSDHNATIDSDEPIDTTGRLRSEWATGAWTRSPDLVMRWAELAATCARAQRAQLEHLADASVAMTVAVNTSHAESAAELLCAELEHDGLPIDLAVAESLIADYIGPRPANAPEAAMLATERDEQVLRHIPSEQRLDLRNPANVKALLRRVGIEVSDTRAWRLEQLRDRHPFVDDLLAWRKSERILTTFGYGWLDANVGADGRLRGSWSGSDGAAGRMTATAGLHNMPADLRSAIVAEPGYVFVRADLGQIEPRILAAVSADPALTIATQADDMYAPVATRLGVGRDIAKVAVLGAMYGQTTGKGAEALRGLEANYPRAMSYLADAARAAEGGNDLRTRGGRLVRMGGTSIDRADDERVTEQSGDRVARSRAAARGRYGRNAMVQGAAAEFFKTWAAIARARLVVLDERARIVLCLHDELLLHVPEEHGPDVARLVDDCLHEAAHRWLGPPGSTSPGLPPVRFVADISTIPRWSDAK